MMFNFWHVDQFLVQFITANISGGAGLEIARDISLYIVDFEQVFTLHFCLFFFTPIVSFM